MQQRCWLGISNSAVGHGGEIKFQDYKDWMWHPMLQVVDIKWTEMKRLARYAMPMVPRKCGWELDFYHQLASYFAVENGLHRSDQQIQDGLENVVFLDLHRFKDEGVTKKISRTLQNNLPNGCPSDVAKSYSAKSMRKEL